MKKIISLLLSVVMIILSVNTAVFAEVSASGTILADTYEKYQNNIIYNRYFNHGETPVFQIGGSSVNLAPNAGDYGKWQLRNTPVVYKIPLPKFSTAQFLKEFYFYYVSTVNASWISVFKLPGEGWESKEGMSVNHPEAKEAIDNAAGTYKAYESDKEVVEIYSSTGSSVGYQIKLDVTSYANECIGAGQTYMYIGVIAQWTAQSFGYEQNQSMYHPLISFSVDGMPELELKSASISDGEQNVAPDGGIVFEFNNPLDADNTLIYLNDEKIEFNCDENVITIDSPLENYKGYRLLVEAVDIYEYEYEKEFVFSSGESSSVRSLTLTDVVPEIKGNVLENLSFRLLTDFVDVNENVEIISFDSGEKLDAEFVSSDGDDTYSLNQEVVLESGKTYCLVIKAGSSDIYGNSAEKDICQAMFTGGAQESIIIPKILKSDADVSAYDELLSESEVDESCKAVVKISDDASDGEYALILASYDNTGSGFRFADSVVSTDIISINDDKYIVTQALSIQDGETVKAFAVDMSSLEVYTPVAVANENGETYLHDGKYCLEDKYDVYNNADGETIGLYYKNSAYANRHASVLVYDSFAEKIVFADRFTINPVGVLSVDKIFLGNSSEYKVSISPSYGNCEIADISFFTPEDIENLWKVIATENDASNMDENWHYISGLFKIDSPYLDYITDKTVFYNRYITLRGDKSFEENSAENIKAVTELINTAALYTALEQNNDTGILANLFEAVLPLVREYDELTFNEWSSYVDTVYYDKLLSVFAELEISDIDSIESIALAMKSAIDDIKIFEVLENVKNASHISQIGVLLNSGENAKLLGIDSEINRYNALNSTNSIDRKLMGKNLTIEEFVQIFKTELEKAVKNEKNSDNGNASVGNGSSSGSSKVSYASSPGPNITLDVMGETQKEPMFTDLSGYEWAKEHIEKLCLKNIISGKSQGIYAPSQNTSREEIVKLICSLFNITSDTDAGFKDVEASSWYAPYVNAASAKGIIKGVGDGMFGVGLPATRQDVAVIITNALKSCGYTLTSSSQPGFADADDIAAYATESVSYLWENAIVFGDENGSFKPEAFITRAEIAVMLSRVYDKYAGGVNQ